MPIQYDLLQYKAINGAPMTEEELQALASFAPELAQRARESGNIISAAVNPQAASPQTSTNTQTGVTSSNLFGRPSAPPIFQNPTEPLPQINPGPDPIIPQSNPLVNPTNIGSGLPGPTQTIHSPSGGIEFGGVGGTDEGKLLAEAELAKMLREQTSTQQSTARRALLDDLSGVLVKQQQAQLGDQMPGIYEDLNSRGLLRSSAVGEKVGLEASKLARQTSEQLALQGLSDRGVAVNDMGATQEAYLGGRGSAIQRRFSLQDFERQLNAGRELGTAASPVVSQPSGKGSGALQGGLGGASVGATVGGPVGAGIGGIIGAVGGGKLGGKA